MLDGLHPALKDLAQVLCDELGGSEAACVLARAGVAAGEDALRRADTLNASGVDSELLSSRQLWLHAWEIVGEQHPQMFAVPAARLGGVGLAVAYALSKPGLESLELEAAERRELMAARRLLADLTGLSSLRRPPRAYRVADTSLALRHAAELISPGTIAMAVGGAASIGRPVLVTAAGVQALRAASDGVSHLALQTLHEELHIALARAARVGSHGWAALSNATEEAVVSALDLTADIWLREARVPARRELIARAGQGNYPRAVRGLLRAMSDDCLHERLAQLGRLAVVAYTDAHACERLNHACGTEHTVGAWLRALPLWD
jgi:hypothetical protein